jgi:hypothetical protein
MRKLTVNSSFVWRFSSNDAHTDKHRIFPKLSVQKRVRRARSTPSPNPLASSVSRRLPISGRPRPPLGTTHRERGPAAIRRRRWVLSLDTSRQGSRHRASSHRTGRVPSEPRVLGSFFCGR